jgi:hypothetical protein
MIELLIPLIIIVSLFVIIDDQTITVEESIGLTDTVEFTLTKNITVEESIVLTDTPDITNWVTINGVRDP